MARGQLLTEEQRGSILKGKLVNSTDCQGDVSVEGCRLWLPQPTELPNDQLGLPFSMHGTNDISSTTRPKENRAQVGFNLI
ncbi:hypothetical protein AC1031_020845 [Aphanomyces cochlioides]|nr:hypothetical protein AC1031_020845 [Aphanomyces cochlioides]